MMRKGFRQIFWGQIGALLCGLLCGETAQADGTSAYAVQISATVQSSPPQITLNWEPDPFGALAYAVFRKAKDATAWDEGTSVPDAANSYTDTNVLVGATYEYQVIKIGNDGYIGYGYIYTGINAALTENRGTVLLVVADTFSASLVPELARLQEDLTGDGWAVIRIDVSSNDTPATVKELVVDAYNADPDNVQAVFLFGHVPILRCGNLNYDGHLARPLPSDAYYGDMDGDWSDDPSYLPSDVELMVGRVDFFNMPGVGADSPWPSELELLRNYLNKDHNWRHKLISVPTKALLGNRFGDFGGEAFAASGFRNFEPLVGPGNTVLANEEDSAPVDQKWSSMLAAGTYLWAYGCGGGSYTSMSGMGTHGTYYDVWSTDIVGQDAKAVFFMLFGSWFGEWDQSDDLLRASLATPTMGLTSCLAGRPHWFFHHMGLGEPIGFSARLTMNNSSLYRNEVNNLTRGIHIALMGDPTLRMHPVAPPASLSGTFGSGGVVLNWSPSSDPVVGYHVYRSESPSGPFSRLTPSLIAGTAFTNSDVSLSSYTYMVRAVKLESSPSGTYFNPSQGIFTTVLPLTLLVSQSSEGIVLQWNSQIGSTYSILSADSLNQPVWIDRSGPIIATNSTSSWVDTDVSDVPQQFYRLSSP
jgi:hypothetical protein